jgi:hypothetical protein
LWPLELKKGYGKGISHLLSRTAVAISQPLGINKLYCLAAPYTKEMAESIGFITLLDLGNEGTFKYPIESHLASIMVINDTKSLYTASEFEKDRILSIRKDLKQSCKEKGPLGFLEIQYNL